MSAFDNVLDLQDQVCYVKCGFCNTILLVSVPCNSLSMVVTVRCGYCTTILSVNMFKSCHVFSSINNHHEETVEPKWEVCSEQVVTEKKPANACCPQLCFSSDEEYDEDSARTNRVIHKPPEKKQRAPSAYNHFIKEEIKRLKIEYPNLTHKQAFSAAAKNWAHFPQAQSKGGEGERAMAVLSNEVHCFGNETRCKLFAPKHPFTSARGSTNDDLSQDDDKRV